MGVAFFAPLAFASGPTNSMRGAAFLSGLSDAIVIDVGGTTTDIGVVGTGGGEVAQGGACVVAEVWHVRIAYNAVADLETIRTCPFGTEDLKVGADHAAS